MNTIKLNDRKAKIIAHRGLSGLEKENTCPAFVAAANRSYFGIETDVHMTKDGKFVSLGHYATVDIKANAKITMFTLDIGGILYNNCEYSDFKY